MQFWVYILRCRDGSYYTGHTDALEARLAEHREGLASDWTDGRLPVELVWCADAPTREEALAFERRVKNWSRAKKEALIAGDWAEVGYFARPPHEGPSTSLGTNEFGDLQNQSDVPQGVGTREAQISFVPRAVEGRRAEA